MSAPDREPRDGFSVDDAQNPQQRSKSAMDAGQVAAENVELQRAVELLPPEERAQLFGLIRRESLSHSGWLPTPAFMREYEALLPGLAERIVAMPEREQTFRHQVTSNVVERDYKLRATGQWLGLASLVLIIVFCVFLAMIGSPREAAIVAGLTIVGTVGVFVAGQITGAPSTSKDVIEPTE